MNLTSISKSEAARYMGIKGEPDSQIREILDRAEKTVRENVKPKYVYREAPISFTADGVKVEGMSAPLTGKDIVKHLSGCNEVIILVATLTGDADKLIRQTGINGMAEALAVDCLCSAAVEQVCNRAEEEIFSHTDAAYRTWRFSPGYGDLPLKLNKDILVYLNAARRIGLTVTEDSLLIPSKSVMAIIGISDKPVQKGVRDCAVCNMRDRCAFSGSGGCGKNN
ncbi:MAG: 5-methyltetrahydrofolate--homocysteine methyltransferase [Ruminococcus sp.]|nr:5-methyltetrahydrofolate--homocysteine methyltransferase [Ruminococcus sp.]